MHWILPHKPLFGAIICIDESMGLYLMKGSALVMPNTVKPQYVLHERVEYLETFLYSYF